MDQLISVPEIAKANGRHRSVIHKIIGKLGIEKHMIKSDHARGQQVVYISIVDYEFVKEALETAPAISEGADEIDNIHGYFYIIQLEPSFDTGRFKLGFATSIEGRLRSHRTAAPFAALVRTWPCRLLWEKTAIECITVGCEKLHTEVFRATDIKVVIERAEKFFRLMPCLVEQ